MTYTRLWLFLTLCSLALIYLVWHLIQRGRLRPAYALLWFGASTLFFIVVVFRKVLAGFAHFLGVEYTPSFAFALGFMFVIVLILQHTVVLSSLAKQNTELAEHVAILKWQVEKLETQLEQRPVDQIEPIQLEEEQFYRMEENN